MNKGTDWLRYRMLHLLRCRKQSIPEILRSFTAHPHSQQCVVMIDNRLGDDQGLCRVGKEARHHTLQSCKLGSEFRRSLGITIQPSFDKLDLFTEVEGGGSEGR